MRIGTAWRLWKEGKIEATPEEMSRLWRTYECLSPYDPEDRQVMRSMSELVAAVIAFRNGTYDPEEGLYGEDPERFMINRVEGYLRAEREDPGYNHRYLLR